MNLRDSKKEEFDETINISSNIKDNKRTIIGKFDLRDLLFLSIAGLLGIIIISFIIFLLHIRSIFILFMILSIVEIPIMTFGFMKTYNMPYFDYFKLKQKSNNTAYRNQMARKEKVSGDKYLMIFELVNSTIDEIEKLIKDLRASIHFDNIQLKLIKERVLITIEINEKVIESDTVNYRKLFDTFRLSNNIKYLSIDDIKNYGKTIKPLKIYGKKYNKDQIKAFENDNPVLNKIKKVELIKDKYSNITNYLLDNYIKEYIKIYKILIYNHPIDIKFINEIINVSEITIYMSIDDNFDIKSASYINTYIAVIGNSDEMDKKIKEVKGIFDKYNVLYKEIDEDNVKKTLLFTMENKY